MAGELDPNQLIQQMLNPQAQQQQANDPIAMLVNLLSPNEAGAATGPDPATAMFRQLQQANQLKMQQQQMQQREQQMKLQAQRGEQQQAAATAKAAPKPSITDILNGGAGGGNDVQRGMLPGDVLGGGADAPITYGRNPRTGIYSFNNYGHVSDPSYDTNGPQMDPRLAGIAAQYASPEMKQRVEKARSGQQQQTAGGGGVNQADLAKHAQVVQLLTKGGYSPTAAAALADQVVPSIGNANRDAEMKQKHDEKVNAPLTPESVSKLWKFNPETRDFDPVPPELIGQNGQELQKQGYRVYSDKQRGVVDELKDVDVAFQQLQSALSGIKDKSAVGLKASQLTGGNLGGPEGAVFQKASTNFTTIFDKFLGGVRGAASPQMQKIRSQVLPQIISTGQVSDILMRDLQDLIHQMGDSRLKSVVGGEQFNAASVNKQAQKVLDTFEGKQSTAEAAAALAAGGKMATREQVNAAVHQAGGDKRKALATLKAQGFTGVQ